MSALGKSYETKSEPQEVAFIRAPARDDTTGDDFNYRRTDFRNAAKGTRYDARQHVPVAPELPAQQHEKQVDAIVSSILDDGILFTCKIGSETTKTIKLPIGLVPVQLRKYAEPVRISLRDQNGVRTPYVEGRTLEEPVDDEFASSFKAWMQAR